MSRSNINFKSMSQEATSQLYYFKSTMLEIAKEDVRYKEEKKSLQAKLESILNDRQNEIEKGMSVDDAVLKFSRVDIDNQIRKAQENHDAIVKPLNECIKSTYIFIPETMYPAYQKKILEHKRGLFLDACKEFLNNLGLDVKAAQVSKFANNMSDMFGARVSTSKTILKDGVYTSTMTKSQFNRLFMSTFCDMFVK